MRVTTASIRSVESQTAPAILHLGSTLDGCGRLLWRTRLVLLLPLLLFFDADPVPVAEPPPLDFEPVPDLLPPFFVLDPVPVIDAAWLPASCCFFAACERCACSTRC